MNELTNKLKQHDTDELQDMAFRLFHDHRDGAHDVFSAVMQELLERMPEQEYVDFCWQVENANEKQEG